MPLAFRRPSTPTIGMIANSAFTSSGRPSSDEPPADTTAGDAHLFSGLAKASSGVAMSGAARQARTAERLIGLIGAGAKPSAAVSASNMALRARSGRFPGNYRWNRGTCKQPASFLISIDTAFLFYRGSEGTYAPDSVERANSGAKKKKSKSRS